MCRWTGSPSPIFEVKIQTKYEKKTPPKFTRPSNSWNHRILGITWVSPGISWVSPGGLKSPQVHWNVPMLQTKLWWVHRQDPRRESFPVDGCGCWLVSKKTHRLGDKYIMFKFFPGGFLGNVGVGVAWINKHPQVECDVYLQLREKTVHSKKVKTCCFLPPFSGTSHRFEFFMQCSRVSTSVSSSRMNHIELAWMSHLK